MFLGGDDGIRTHDPLLAGQVLSQLSYTPILLGLLSPYFRLWESRSLCSPFVYVSIGLSSRTASREVFSPLQSLTSVFGMGTGGPSAFVTLTFLSNSWSLKIEQQFHSYFLRSVFLVYLWVRNRDSRPIALSP